MPTHSRGRLAGGSSRQPRAGWLCRPRRQRCPQALGGAAAPSVCGEHGAPASSAAPRGSQCKACRCRGQVWRGVCARAGARAPGQRRGVLELGPGGGNPSLQGSPELAGRHGASGTCCVSGPRLRCGLLALTLGRGPGHRASAARGPVTAGCCPPRVSVEKQAPLGNKRDSGGPRPLHHRRGCPFALLSLGPRLPRVLQHSTGPGQDGPVRSIAALRACGFRVAGAVGGTAGARHRSVQPALGTVVRAAAGLCGTWRELRLEGPLELVSQLLSLRVPRIPGAGHPCLFRPPALRRCGPWTLDVGLLPTPCTSSALAPGLGHVRPCSWAVSSLR